MRLSMRFLMLAGEGANRVDSCLVTSATSMLCSICLRAFMMRTMAASIRCLRSSSTGAGTAVVTTAVAVVRLETSGTLTRMSLEVKPSLKVKRSAASISLPLRSLIKMRCRGVVNEMRCRLNSASGIWVAARISAKVNVSTSPEPPAPPAAADEPPAPPPPLKSSRITIWKVLTVNSCRLAPKTARRSAVPRLVSHERRRPVRDRR
mmetsp:Transcript_85216/g.237175  ORF Transcript_85216/g.237175 Transcript_85216/m.237175 type:complete len:206 (-) Transcript_85216:1450-2067(-)